MATGIKETMDVVALIETTAVEITAAKADGHIDWRDAPKVAPVLVALKTALDGGNLIPEELKDLDSGEVQTLLEATLTAAQHLAMAIVS